MDKWTFVTLDLPYPPSTNRIWRRAGRRTILAASAIAYRDKVAAVVYDVGSPSFGDSDVEIDILACPPDKRRRDLDNILKSVLDAIVKAGVLDDDSQIQRIIVQWAHAVKGGVISLSIRSLS